MVNSQSKEYYCKEKDLGNLDTVYTIKHNSIWNCNNNSKNNLISEETVLTVI